MLEIVDADPSVPAARHCLGRYFAELEGRFDEGFDPAASSAPTLDEFAPPSGCFLIAWESGRAVGCGGFKRFSADQAYLKRMWVDEDMRGRGVGSALLAALENRAAAIGYSTMLLETHRNLGEAQSLYRSCGYREVPAFNDEAYADHWFEKPL